jgi:hypothetical protein
MAKTWQDLSTREFFTMMETPEAQAIANQHHAAIYGEGEEHSMFHSCPCAHRSVQELLDAAE